MIFFPIDLFFAELAKKKLKKRKRKQFRVCVKIIFKSSLRILWKARVEVRPIRHTRDE